MTKNVLFGLLTLAATACSGGEPAPASAPAPAAPTAAPAQPSTPTEPSPAAAAADENADEVCGQILVVAYQGAAKAKPDVTRDKPAAEKRAAELLVRVQKGEDFAQLARSESDAASSAARGGFMGTFEKATWPELHAAIREPLFALAVGGVASAPVDADYGVTLVKRCPVEKARARHILVRYRGAKNAADDVERNKEQAAAHAQALLDRVAKGEDFAALATAESDDGSAERGGDIGAVGRGLLAPAFETALFGLEVGKRALVETDFGFHVIERLPLE